MYWLNKYTLHLYLIQIVKKKTEIFLLNLKPRQPKHSVDLFLWIQEQDKVLRIYKNLWNPLKLIHMKLDLRKALSPQKLLKQNYKAPITYV